MAQHNDRMDKREEIIKTESRNLGGIIMMRSIRADS